MSKRPNEIPPEVEILDEDEFSTNQSGVVIDHYVAGANYLGSGMYITNEED